MLKRGVLLLFVFPIILFSTIGYAHAVTCDPPFNGNWTVPGDCTYPAGGIKVFGNINVGGWTITVPNGVILGINLTSNKVEFSTNGKILFQGSGKMDNTVSVRNYITLNYTSTGGETNCPSGYSIVNTAGNNFQGSSVTIVGNTGTIICGKL